MGGDVNRIHARYKEELEYIRTTRDGDLLVPRFQQLLRYDGEIGLFIPRGVGGDIRLQFWPPQPIGPKKRTIARAVLFTLTSKMRCASYSIPAGPPRQGGSCRAAALGAKTNHPEEFICHGCYAYGGRYGEVAGTVQTCQAARLVWTVASLRAGTFVDEFTQALRQFFRAPRKDRYGNVASRRYFRIHDCGDFSGIGEAYFDAWCRIASNFPRVKFWSPTRDWAMPNDWVYKSRPENLVVRPSALHSSDEPPYIRRLDAGTTAAMPDDSLADWNCPAYAGLNEHNCENVKGPNGRRPCRACWDSPEMSVNYKPHGKLSTMVKKNPPAELEELWDEYLRTRKNPPVGFEAWMLSKGFDPASWDEERWYEFLTEVQGMTEDEAADHIQGTAEYMV